MILLIGPQGSGKGTQAELLASKTRAKHLSTGDILRASSDPKVHAELKTGRLFDDATMTAVVKEALGKLPPGTRVILDGYPRNLNQAKQLEKALDSRTRQIEVVIHLDVPRTEAMKRLLKRGRPDDTEQAINLRLDQYETATVPVLDYYRERGLLQTVNGVGKIADIARRIEQVVPWE